MNNLSLYKVKSHFWWDLMQLSFTYTEDSTRIAFVFAFFFFFFNKNNHIQPSSFSETHLYSFVHPVWLCLVSMTKVWHCGIFATQDSNLSSTPPLLDEKIQYNDITLWDALCICHIGWWLCLLNRSHESEPPALLPWHHSPPEERQDKRLHTERAEIREHVHLKIRISFF